MSDDISLENHNQAIQDLQTKLDEAQDKHDKQLAKLAKIRTQKSTNESLRQSLRHWHQNFPPLCDNPFSPGFNPVQNSPYGSEMSSSASTTVPLNGGMAASTSLASITALQSVLDDAGNKNRKRSIGTRGRP